MKNKFILTFVLFAIIFALLYKGVQDLDFIDSDKNQERTNSITTYKDSTEIESVDSDNLIFLLCGVDSADIEESGTRTDAIIIIKTDFDTGEISLLSIPRDTKITINNKTQKINSAHAINGMELTMETVNDLLGLDIEYYVKVDYKVVMDVVDIIGGVEIEVPFLMEYKDPVAVPPLDIYIEEGLRVLDGKNAHDFLRWRKNNLQTVQYPEGDLGRIKAQQYFLTEMIKQTLNSDNLMIKMPSIAKTYFENIETNLNMQAIFKGIRLANNLDTDNIVSEVLPGEGRYIGNVSYYLHDEEETKEVVNRLYR
ncbi:MAG: LCP family protein [Sedimentibacter sp.]|jgi:LCP family protein required for cell wall assembly